jgi:hypothetical protein
VLGVDLVFGYFVPPLYGHCITNHLIFTIDFDVHFFIQQFVFYFFEVGQNVFANLGFGKHIVLIQKIIKG